MDISVSSSIPALIIFAVSILFLLFQLFLSFRNSKWPGLIPAALIAVIALSLTLHNVHTMHSYTTERLKSQTANGYELGVTIRYDAQRHLVDYSEITIHDKEGNLLDSMWVEFDHQGNIIEDDSSAAYVKEVEKLIGDRKITGSPTLDSDGEKMIRLSDGAYATPFIFLYFSAFPCLFLLLIHIIVRVAAKRKRLNKELKKVKIDNL